MNAEGVILSLRCVRVHFGGVVALDLDAMDLQRAAGLAALFIGPNGAGKTTLLNAITGYVPIAKGEILLIDGKAERVDGLARPAIVRKGIVRTFQTPPLFASLSLREGVALAALAGDLTSATERMVAFLRRGRSESRTSRLVNALIEELGLSDSAKTAMCELPLHLVRRAELARCLAGQPRVLLLDEPSAGADDAEREYMANLLARGLVSLVARLAAAGLYSRAQLTVCLVTHDMSLARRASAATEKPPTAFFLDQGKLIASGPLEAVMCDERVRRTYLGEAREHA